MIKHILQHLNPWGPVLFGLGFLAPLFATLLMRAGLPTVFGCSAAQTGLVLGIAWGLYAKVRGSWL